MARGTKIELVQGIKNGTATVNITNLKSGAFGSSHERCLDSLVYTLTQFSEPGIKRVRVLVDSKTKAGRACGRQPPPGAGSHINWISWVTASPTRIMPWLLLCILPSKVPCTGPGNPPGSQNQGRSELPSRNSSADRKQNPG